MHGSSFLSPDLFGLLMGLNVPKPGFGNGLEVITRKGAAYLAALGCPFPGPVSTVDIFRHTREEMAQPFELGPPEYNAD